MSPLSSHRQFLKRVQSLVGRAGFTAPTQDPHPPRPLQQQSMRPEGASLKLNQRRVTLSRSARQWSRGIVWSLVGLTGFTLVYGSVARIESSVEANGTLEPIEGVTKISAPFAAQIRDVLVKDGERVRANQPLVVLSDESATQSMRSLRRSRDQVQRDLAITRKRLGLTPVNADTLDDDANREQVIADLELRLREQILQQEMLKARLSERGETSVLAKLRERLLISERTLDRLTNLYKEGAVSALQVDQERQRLLDTRMQLDKQQTLVEQTPLQSIATALRAQHVTVQEQRDLYKRLGELNHNLADLDRQLADQQKRTSLLTLRAPSDGVIFDLDIKKGELANPSVPILDVVPSQGLKAKVMIPNKDIGFVKEGMPVQLRVASYPFTEYGSINGTLMSIGADSKQTNPNSPAEHFPAVVKIDVSSLERPGQSLPLKPGMSVTALVKLGSRPAISLLSDRIVSLFDGVRHIR